MLFVGAFFRAVTVSFVSLRGWFLIHANAVLYYGEKMKPIQLSWLLGTLSYVLLGVLRRSVPRVVEISPGDNAFLLFLLAIVMAGMGTVFGFMSWKRKETKAWWIIVIIVLNITTLFTGILFLLPG
jgi:hypothetical protein